MRLLHSLLVTAMLLCMAAAEITVPASAGTATATITGRVLDGDGTPVNALRVEATNSTGVIAEAATGGQGRFTLTITDVSESVVVHLVDVAYGQLRARTLAPVPLTAGQAVDVGDVTMSSGGTAGRAANAVKTSSRAAVRSAYVTRYRPLLVGQRLFVPRRDRPCRVVYGKGYARQRARQITQVNFMRSLAGVAPVKQSALLSERAAAAALIEYHLGYLNHFPPRSSQCWTRVGSRAAGHSNLAYGSAPSDTVGLYMTDPGDSNRPVGHRSWILDPSQVQMGTGSVGTFNALYVVSKSARSNPTPRWMRWPSAGYFPSNLEPRGRWSFSSTRLNDVDLNGARVRVTRAGHRVALARLTRSMYYGRMTTLTFDFKRPPTRGTYNVTVTGIRQRGRLIDPVHYPVRLFRVR